MTGTFPGMNGQSPPMRLVIVDDHQMVLDGLKAMLRPYAGQVEVAGEASDPGEAVGLVARLRVGAAGFLLKRIRGGELVEYLRRIGDGEVLIDPSLAGRVALSAARLHSGEFWPGAHLGLTQRESEVLSLLVAGLSNRAIAAKLVVSEETVKTHSRGIYRKLGVSDRAAAVTVALREGVFH
jgi:DNA-binding NarL/FixJ family response regulator